MAAEPKALFTVDAGKILAKLHLAGVQQAPNYFVINSAVQKDSSGTPEDPKDTKFDMSSKDGIYEVCLIKKDFAYKEQINPDLDPALVKTKAKIEEAKKSQKLTDTDDKIKKLNREYTNRLKVLGVAKVKIDLPFSSEENKNALAEENKKREEDKNKSLEDLKKEVFSELKDGYFTTFVGKDAASKIQESSMVMQQMPIKCDKIKDIEFNGFKIMPISKKDMKTWQDEIAKAQDKEASINIGFKVAYQIDIDTI